MAISLFWNSNCYDLGSEGWPGYINISKHIKEIKLPVLKDFDHGNAYL